MDDRAAARFWAKVQRRGPHECWPWTAGVDKDGYGKLKMPDGTHVRSNRAVFFLTHGNWPDFGCHTCDVTGCCNPRHVFDGSPQDNVADMVKKLRHARGRRIGNAYMTPDAVLGIRASTLTVTEASKAFKTSIPNVISIRQRRTWAHL
jgi:hypothetical protein